MTFQKQNKFWLKRTKHGRDKLFSSPEVLWEAACEYFEDVINNPFEVKTTTTTEKGTFQNINEHRRPFTWQALELYLDISSLREYKNNPNYSDFSQIITRIEQVIYSNKFEGASSGLFNSNIIARDLGLIEKTDTTSNGKELKGDTINVNIDGKAIKLE